MSRPRGRWRAPLLVAVLAGAPACNGHLDFGAGAGGGGGGGSPGLLGGGGIGGGIGGGGRGGVGGGGGTGGGGGCVADPDCLLPSLHCDVAGTRSCVPCVTDAHCTTGGLGRCDPALHRCVGCLAAGDCAATQVCAGARCATTCVDDGTPGCPGSDHCQSGLCSACGDDGQGCAALPATPFCRASAGLCVACRSDADCGGATSRCDPVRFTCEQCATSADCPVAAPLCDPTTGRCASG